jgi:HEAT repeat protein
MVPHMGSKWFVRLDQTNSSYSILTTLLTIVLVVVFLNQIGLLGWALGHFGRATRWTIRWGFWTWEQCLSWANWRVFLLLTVLLVGIGAISAGSMPPVAIGCALVTMSMGATSCLAYMYIDIERYEVERGRKAVYNPTKGQDLAHNVARYGHQLEVTLLAVAAASVIGGFALLNQGLYESIGREWYRVEAPTDPAFVDFLSYAIINLLSLVDVLDLADTRQVLHATFVRKGTWPSATLVAIFRSFFTMIFLQQIFASVRQGRLLSETIADFWSPHEPIHDRARNSLPQFGAAAIAPILTSLREMSSITKEQRDQLPVILAAIGPSTIPALMHHLSDSHEHVRAVAASTLGQLNARTAIGPLAHLAVDENDLVRLSAIEALGSIAAEGMKNKPSRAIRAKRFGWSQRTAETVEQSPANAVAALRNGLSDSHTAIRAASAASLGRIGPAAVDTVDLLATLFNDVDETVRCQAAEAFGHVGGMPQLLEPLLEDPSAAVRSAAARGLKHLGHKAAASAPKLIELLQDHDEGVRSAASAAVNAAGPLDNQTTLKLAAGLSSPDNVVRALAAEALGTVEAPVEHAAPPLVEALTDRNDAVRAKAVEALGKIGEAAADVAVPSLVRALNDRDSWVSALAAEALGEMGTCEGVLPGLMRSLRHVNPQVRANSAEALGKLGPAAGSARTALERAASDEDGSVRSQAIRALGSLGQPGSETTQLISAAMEDPDPLVRAAAAAAIGAWDRPSESLLTNLISLLRDPNDQVKAQACEVLSKQESGVELAAEGISQLLTEDNNTWVQSIAAMALGRMGPGASGAGAALLRLTQTGEAEAREQAMRALVMIQSPEALEAFKAGLSDAEAEVRLVASAGWMKASSVPASAGSALVEALRDPEPQVRANASHALARLEQLPSEAVTELQKCLSDPNDRLRLNATLALQLAPAAEVTDLMKQLLDDSNVRVRLIAAGAILERDSTNSRAAAVVFAAADDPSPRVRESVENLLPLIHKAPEKLNGDAQQTASQS